MSEQKGSTLARKLAAVMGEVERVKKTGRNDYHKYDYATESDLTDAIRSKLAEQGVAILPSVLDARSEPLASSKRSEVLTTVELEITLICADSGEARTTRWRGQGLDGGDKGYYKAYTGAMKYFLMKTFLISTGDDPEDDEQPAAPQRAEKSAPKGQDKPSGAGADKGEVERWQALMSEIGITVQDKELIGRASAATAVGFKQRSVREMTTEDLRRANDKLAGMTPEQREAFMKDKLASQPEKSAA